MGKKTRRKGKKHTHSRVGEGKRVEEADKARANGTRAKNDEERAKVSAAGEGRWATGRGEGRRGARERREKWKRVADRDLADSQRGAAPSRRGVRYS